MMKIAIAMIAQTITGLNCPARVSAKSMDNLLKIFISYIISVILRIGNCENNIIRILTVITRPPLRGPKSLTTHVWILIGG